MRNLSRNIRIVLGLLSLVVGLAGLILPILQGWLFICLGLVLLSKDIPFFKRLSDRLDRRFPKLAGMRRAVKEKFTRGRKS